MWQYSFDNVGTLTSYISWAIIRLIPNVYRFARYSMVDRLITSYRAQIYDWSFADLKNLFFENKKFWGTAIGTMVAVVALLVVGVVCKNYYLEFLAFTLEIIIILRADRYAVKQHRKALINRKEHLSIVNDFLSTFAT